MKLLFFASVVAMASSVFATWKYAADDVWLAVGGEYSGSVTDTAHWSKGFCPDNQVAEDGAQTNFYIGVFSAHPGTPYTVTFPEGEYTLDGGLQVKLANGDDITFDGRNTVFCHGVAGFDRYPYRVGVDTSKFLWFPTTGEIPGGAGVLSNFRWRTAMADNVARVELLDGTYDYRSNEWRAFSDAAIADLEEARLTLGPGVETKTGKITFGGQSAKRNVFAANGATLTVDGAFSSVFAGSVSQYQDIYLTNGTVLAASGDSAHVGAVGRTNTLTVADSTFSSGLFSASSGFGRITFDRSVATFSGTASIGGGRDVRAAFVNGSVVTNLCLTVGKNAFDLGTSGGAYTTAVRIVDSDVRFFRHVNVGNETAGTRTTLALTNSVFSHLEGNANNYLNLSGDTLVDLYDSTCRVATVYAGNVNASKRTAPKIHLGGKSSLTTDGTNAYLGKEDNAELLMEGESGFAVSGASLYLGGDTSKGDAKAYTTAPTGTLTVVGHATYRCLGARTAVGHLPGTYGVLNVRDEATVSPGKLQIGRYGTGVVNVEGGTVTAGVIFTIAGDTDTVNNGHVDPIVVVTEESVLNQTGGTINSSGTDFGLEVAVQAGRRGRVVLNGGELKVHHLRGGIASRSYPTPGTGWAALEADGGTLVARAADANLIAYFDEAKLGEKGLTIESGFDVTIPQDFTDKAGAANKGALILAGAGVKTLAMTTSAPSVVVAADGGDVVFGAGAAMPKTLVVTNGMRVVLSTAATFENLVLGDETSVGVLEISPETEITVTGDLDIAYLQLALVGDFPLDTSYSLFSCPNGVSDASVKALAAAFTKSGLAEGTACSFEKVSGAGGAVTLRMNIVKADPLVIHVGAGQSETHATNIIYNASQTLEAIVDADASLTLSGKVGYGALEKSGAGTLYLTGLEKVFYPGLTLLEGVISVSDLTQLGNDHVQNVAGPRLCCGMLEVTGEGTAEYDRPWSIEGTETTSLVEVDAKTDVTLPMPTVTQGAFRKRGPGQLVFEATENGKELAFTKDGNGVKENEELTGYTGFTVQEGEMVFRGKEPGLENTLATTMHVGVLGEAHVPRKVQPGLVVDMSAIFLGNNTIAFAPGVDNEATNRSTGAISSHANSFVTDPYLIVTNGGVLSAGKYDSFGDCPGTPGTHHRHLLGAFHLLADNGTVRATASFATSSCAGDPTLAAKGADGVRAHHVFRNGASLRTPKVTVGGTSTLTFDHAFMGGSSLTERTPTEICHDSNELTSRWDFVSSEFCVSRVWRSAQAYQCRYFQGYTFEDTLWSCGDNDLLVGATNVNMNIFVRGRGLRFAPYEGRTYTVRRKIRGKGGIVMDGPGTLVFGRSQYLNKEQCDTIEYGNQWYNGATTDTEHYDPCTVAYTGATEVNGGTIDFGGFSLTNMAFTGAGGRIENATLVNATIASTNLTFAADVAFEGRTRVDFAGLDVADGDVVAVGHYEGTAPDVTLWRGRNFKTRGLMATFAAEGGDIVATIRSSGLMLIVR